LTVKWQSLGYSFGYNDGGKGYPPASCPLMAVKKDCTDRGFRFKGLTVQVRMIDPRNVVTARWKRWGALLELFLPIPSLSTVSSVHFTPCTHNYRLITGTSRPISDTTQYEALALVHMTVMRRLQLAGDRGHRVGMEEYCSDIKRAFFFFRFGTKRNTSRSASKYKFE